MTVLSFLRDNESVDVKPTKFRSGLRDVENTIRHFLKPKPEKRLPYDYKEQDFHDLFPNYIYNPKHQNDVIHHNRQGSPGLFMRKRGFRTQGDVLDNDKAQYVIKSTIHNLKLGQRRTFTSYVVAVNAIYDEPSNSVKTRVAWVPDITLTRIELMFAQPIIESIDHKRKVFSPEQHHMSFCNDTSLNIDISSFDTSVAKWLIHEAFSIIFAHFDLSRYHERGVPYDPQSLQRLINVLIHNFIFTRFVTPFTSIVRRKTSGIPSGSAFTNLVDSVISRICALITLKELGYKRYLIHSNGDDTCINFCTSSPPHADLLRVYGDIGMSAKIIDKLPWGCNIYSKAYCVFGQSFHPGLWYRNIIECIRDIRYLNTVITCLILTYNPTALQRYQLTQFYSNDPYIRDDIPMWLIDMFTQGAR